MKRSWYKERGMQKRVFYLVIMLLGIANIHCNDPESTRKSKQASGRGESSVLHLNEIKPLLKDTQEINRVLKQCIGPDIISSDSIYKVSLDALASSRELAYDWGIAKSFQVIAVWYNSKESYDTALAHFHQSFHYYEKAKAEACQPANIYNSIGIIYEQLGKFDSSLSYYLQAIDLINQSKHTDCKSSQLILAGIYTNLANILSKSNSPVVDSPKALMYYHKAMDMAYKLRNNYMMATVHLCLANYFGPKDLDSAICHFREGVRLNRESKDITVLGEAYRILGNTYANRDDWATAKKYWDTAVSYYKTKENTSPYYGDVLLGIGSYYTSIKAYKEAVGYFEQAEVIYQQQKNISSSAILYNNWGTLYERTGNWQAAYEKKLMQDSLNKLLINEEIIKTSQLMEARFRSMEKDKSLAVLQSRVQRQYLGIGSLAAIVIIISLTTFMLLRQRKHKNEIAQLRALRDGEEKERLRLAQELHDGIVSELSAIKMHLQHILLQDNDTNEGREDYEKVVHSLEQSISELRDTSHNLQPSILQQEGLLAAIKLFCNRLNQPGSMEISFIAMDTLPQLTSEFQLNAYRIVQEVIHNIIKHATAVTGIVVQVDQMPDSPLLLISIEDNGRPQSFGKKHHDPQSGTGLFNLGKRVELLHGKMEQVSNERGNAVYLEFDLTSYKKPKAQCA